MGWVLSLDNNIDKVVKKECCPTPVQKFGNIKSFQSVTMKFEQGSCFKCMCVFSIVVLQKNY